MPIGGKEFPALLWFPHNRQFSKQRKDQPLIRYAGVTVFSATNRSLLCTRLQTDNTDISPGANDADAATFGQRFRLPGSDCYSSVETVVVVEDKNRVSFFLPRLCIVAVDPYGSLHPPKKAWLSSHALRQVIEFYSYREESCKQTSIASRMETRTTSNLQTSWAAP